METQAHPPPDAHWAAGRQHGDHWQHTFPRPAAAQRPALACTAVGMRPLHLPQAPRVFDHHVALVVLTGSGWLSWGGREPVDVVAPVLLRLPPGTEHSYGPRTADWSECYAGFTGTALAAHGENGHPDDIVTRLSSAGPVRRAVRKLATVCDETEPHFASFAAIGLQEFLATLRRGRAGPGRHVPTVLERFAEAAVLPISVPEHSRRLALPRDDLRDAVGRAVGCSPKEFILTTRLNLAKDLLATTGLTVAAVARRVGYPDQGYFTRLFTKRVGTPPSSFRLRHARPS